MACVFKAISNPQQIISNSAQHTLCNTKFICRSHIFQVIQALLLTVTKDTVAVLLTSLALNHWTLTSIVMGLNPAHEIA